MQSPRLPRIEGEASAGPPAQPHPFPSALTLGGSHHGNPKVRGGWGEGDQLLLPFVFPLWFFVSSFFPASALGGPLPVSCVTLSSFPTFSTAGSFPGSLSSPLWSLCFCLSDFLLSCSLGLQLAQHGPGGSPEARILPTLPLPNSAWMHRSAHPWPGHSSDPSRPTTPTCASARGREAWHLILPQSGTWHFSRCGRRGSHHRGCFLGSGPIPTLFCPGGWLRLCTPHPSSHHCLCT